MNTSGAAASSSASSTAASLSTSLAPSRPKLTLAALILGAAVANMNLSVANVGLPDIGRDLQASQVGLNLVAVGFALGLAASVLYLGAVGDRYGRKAMLMIGLIGGIPAAMMSALAPNVDVLFTSRLLGGLAAGMAYPTTLALITALWSGPGRVRAIAMWSALGAGLSALSPVLAGAIMLKFSWNWAFLIAIPFAVIALILIAKYVPAHVNESDEKVDHIGGILSAAFIGGLVLGINFVALDGFLTTALIMLGISVVAGVGFFWRQAATSHPLFDLRYARRRTFWVAAVAGIIVFGVLIGAMFIGQQYLQNVLGYNTFEAGLAVLPCVIGMIAVAGFGGYLTNRVGSRITLLVGFLLCMLGFFLMYILWTLSSPVWQVWICYLLIGLGVGIAGTPASHALTDSVPVRKVGMASGTGDLQRDLGGSIMQSLMGAILSAGYAGAVAVHIADAPDSVKSQITSSVSNALQRSFGSAADFAAQYPQYQQQIIEAAKQSFLQGANWAYIGGLAIMTLGVLLVIFLFPRRDKERAMYAEFAKAD